MASLFLPPRKRRAAFAFYSLGRGNTDLLTSLADDRKALVRGLTFRRRDLFEAIDGRPRGPVLREVRWAMREFGIPAEPLIGIVDGASQDAMTNRFATWEELECHSARVTAAVGMMCTHVFGLHDGTAHREEALEYARTLGVAMRLTRILRDALANAGRGHCYIPDDELARFELARAEVLTNPAILHDARWQELIAFEISRARALYERALPGIGLLAEDSQRCAAACTIGYAAILDALEHLRYSSISTRASIGSFARVGIMWEAWRFTSREH